MIQRLKSKKFPYIGSVYDVLIAIKSFRAYIAHLSDKNPLTASNSILGGFVPLPGTPLFFTVVPFYRVKKRLKKIRFGLT
jgi:hypothetical protein